FPSRRRHTMFSRDWSSDVCSSDLVWSGLGPDRRLLTTGIGVVSLAAVVLPVAATVLVVAARRWSGPRGATGLAAAGVAVAFVARSEERRVVYESSGALLFDCISTL